MNQNHLNPAASVAQRLLYWEASFNRRDLGMSGPHAGPSQHGLVLSQDQWLGEELRAGLGRHSGWGTSAPSAAADGAAPEATASTCRLEEAAGPQTAIRMAQAALAAGAPYHVAWVGVDDASPDSSLLAAVGLWRVDPELPVVFCVSEAGCAWAEAVGTRDHPDRTAILQRPIDPVQARQLFRILSAQRHRAAVSPSAWPRTAEVLDRTSTGPTRPTCQPAFDLAAGAAAAAPNGRRPGLTPSLAGEREGERRAGEAPADDATVVLLVEDDDAVRQVTRLVLESSGCEIFEAGDSVEALRLWQAHGAAVRLLVTDLVIPGQVDGLQFAKQLRAERSDLKVLLTTGFAAESFASEFEDKNGIEFLSKPYTCSQMQGALHRLLGPRPAHGFASDHAK
jgi:CheY-like chemotaxis protein